jgi:alkylated DNA repair dioxygenase AlkB
MDLPITYLPKFVDDPDSVFAALWTEISWLRIGSTPRREYFCTDIGTSYTYGRGAGVRTYEPQPWHPAMRAIRDKLEALTNTTFEVLFLNGYENSSDSLGFHADNSSTMDDARPIAIISLGAERDIIFTSQEAMKDASKHTRMKLQHGSLCLMLPGMQDTHFHRIPKAGFVCGPRISLTHRGYVADVEPDFK